MVQTWSGWGRDLEWPCPHDRTRKDGQEWGQHRSVRAEDAELLFAFGHQRRIRAHGAHSSIHADVRLSIGGRLAGS